MNPASHNLDHLQTVANQDVVALTKAHKNYGDSWKRRGGVGAYMMLARKWDRLENFLSTLKVGVNSERWDILKAVEHDNRPEGIIDDIRDLRRYLMLVEAEAIAQGYCPGMLAKENA